MKYLPLILSSLLRHPLRTVLTVASIAVAFLLFGTLDTVRVDLGPQGGVQAQSRVIVTSRMSIQQPLPRSLRPTIAGVSGVTATAGAVWFGAFYKDPRNQITTFAVDDGYLDLYDETVLAPEQRKAFDATFTGAVVSQALASRFGWKLGDKIPLKSSIFPDLHGDDTWTFDIVGIFHDRDATATASKQLMLFHWKYFSENNLFGAHNVHWYVARVASPAVASEVASRIDGLTANSDHETRTQTEQAFKASLVRQVVDVGFATVSIMGAVFFALLLLTGNVMMQAVHERTSELAVLKTVGFSNFAVLLVVLAESVLILLVGGVVGLLLANGVLPIIAAKTGGIVPFRSMGPGGWISGIVMMLIVALVVGGLPAIRAMRLRIVDALTVH